MADSYSVKAVLSATDQGFTSTLKNANKATESLGSKIKSGFSFGLLTGAGQQAFSMLTSGVKNVISEIDSSNAAWKTFTGNMEMLGKSKGEIDSVKKELQAFAEQTVYSSSDMATTFSQLEAVGTKNTTQLVKGFGGLAAAAENPQQAMKTLSQQATQMAAKPQVAWQDFKLMLEQTPAGIAAVAKEMGMTTSELVTNVQDGKIATDDFFAAIAKVGTSDSFTKLATEYKTVGQAMDGLQETIGNKLTPAFDVLSGVAIGAISKIIDKVGEIDGAAIADKVTAGIEKAKPYWEAFKDIAIEVGGAIKKLGSFLLEHSDTISKALPYIIGLVGAYKAFKFINSVVPGVSLFTKSITKLAGKGIGKIAGKLFGISSAQKEVGKSSASSSGDMLAAAKATLMLAGAVLLISAGFALLAFSAISLAKSGGLAIGVMAGLVLALVGLGVGMAFLLKTLAPMAGQLMPVATAMLALGGAVLLIAAGFALLAFAAISLANAGGLAIAVMVGMVAAIALLAVGAALLGTALTAGAVGFVAFGAALVLFGLGAVLAASALAIISAVLPNIVAYGLQGALAIAALGASMLVFAVGAALAGAGCVVLGAGLAVVGAGLLLVGAAVLITAAGVLVLAAGCIVLGAGLMITAAALTLIGVLLPIVAAGALLVMASFAAMLGISAGLSAVLLIVSAALIALSLASAAAALGIAAFGLGMAASAAGVLAMAGALKLVNSSMKSISKNAKSTKKSLDSMKKSVKVVESGLDAMGNKAKSAMDKLTSAFDNSASKAQSAGKKVGTGFTSGMMTGLSQAPSVARTMVVSACAVLSNGYASAYSSGRFIGVGFANGMRSMLGTIRSAAAQMASAADAAVRAKAKIGSPSRVAKKLGAWWGEGYGIGVLDMIDYVKAASQKLVNIPAVETPDMRLAYAGEMSADYDYYRDYQYTIEVPVIVDGRETAKATAVYMQSELDKRQSRESRKRGKA